MAKLSLQGKKIRLYFHSDMDGTVAALLIKLFSGSEIIEFVPCPYQNFPKKEPVSGVLDVFVDCRSQKDFKKKPWDKQTWEDIRIDHHGAGEPKEYLAKEGIILKTNYDSAVRLVADVLGISIDKTILRQMDKADSGRVHAFFDFKLKDDTFINLIKNGAVKDFKEWESFQRFVLSYMGEGIHVDKDIDKNGKEQEMKQKYGIDILELKKTDRSPLIKIFYTHHKAEHFFFHRLFSSMTKTDFFKEVNSYIKRFYHEATGSCNMGVYVVAGFLAPQDWKGQDNPEPFEIFVSRSPFHTTLDIGKIIQQAKAIAKIANGGGRPDVGGMNTSDREKAIKALDYIFQAIVRNC